MRDLIEDILGVAMIFGAGYGLMILGHGFGL